MLIASNGLNGRTSDDIPGEFTLLSNSGKSTIDLEWVNMECLENISSFKMSPTLTNSNQSKLLSKRNYNK